MDINILYNKIAWFGKYSGYECLSNYFPAEAKATIINASEKTLPKRVVGKYYQIFTNQTDIDSNHLSSGISFLKRTKLTTISHILYLESHLHLLSLAPNSHRKSLVGTIHLPFNQWSTLQLKSLKNLTNAIILYENEIEKFQQYLPNNKMKFIRHGVDVCRMDNLRSCRE